MAGSAWLAARAALHTRLSGDATLATLVGSRVLNGEPAKSPALPFVVIGEAVEEPNNRMGGKVGRSLIVTVHVWSTLTSDTQRDQITDRVDELLDNYLALAVTGYAVERLDMIDMQYLVDSPVGGVWTPSRHVVARYLLDLVEAP